jgi:membrane-bound lytic murein transglycosylase D
LTARSSGADPLAVHGFADGPSRWASALSRAAGPVVLGLFLARCGSTSPRAATGPPPEPALVRRAEDPREAATDRFYRGKTHALSGDAECARLEFDEALESFRTHARPGDTDDLNFAAQLYDSIRLYRGLIDGRAEAEERPPVETSRDALIVPSLAPTAEEVEAATREVASEGAALAFDIPMVVNDAVLKAVAFYQFRTPQAFAAALRRRGGYEALMRGILKDKGLPEDLVNVAMIESAFKPAAHSRKGAHGFWQFIEGTAKRYGMKRTKALDERSDPVKSTLAAAAYYRDLYELFGDWHLAMAAYDTGEGRVLRALRRTGATNYWELVAAGALHRETVAYVPFVLAAALISKDPTRFGFDVVPDPPIEFETISLGKPVDLMRLAERLGVPFDDLRLLNPELRTRFTPSDRSNYPLRVPNGSADAVRAVLASLPAPPETEERRVSIRKGDTVARVAKRAKVSIAELCEWNDLTETTRLRKGMVLVVEVRKNRSGRAARSEPTSSASASIPPTTPLAARARGEVRALPTPSAAVTSPIVVAGLAVLPEAAPLPSVVDIPAEGFEVERPVARPRKALEEGRASSYTVRKGDTLFRIASNFGVTVDALRRENRIGSRDRLRPGRRLTVPRKATR